MRRLLALFTSFVVTVGVVYLVIILIITRLDNRVPSSVNSFSGRFTSSKSNPFPKNNSRVKGGSKRERPKVILIYTTLFGALPWPWAPYSYNFTENKGVSCEVRNCQLTYDKSRLNTSDLVIFHGRDLQRAEDLRVIRQTLLTQIWAFLIHESPQFTYINIADYNGLFNWSVTYRGDSDVYMPYNGWRQRSTPTYEDQRNYAEGKSKLITFVNSHCDDTRMAFIRKLKKYIPVDVYGRCSKMFSERLPDCPRQSKTCDDMQRQYKFYLAFENGFCRDYITEKYWINGLAAGLVPVVVGGANYSDPKIAIQGSFIDALEFKSAKGLADYLLFLNRNDTAYNRYHKWRTRFELYEGNILCSICKTLNTGRIEKKTIDMVDFWGKEKNCENRPMKFQKLIGND